MEIIRVSEVTYEYPGKLALNKVSFSLEPQTITALVGPNGAGKTTLMNCLAGLNQPLSGNLFIKEISVLENPRKCHQMLGYLPDHFGLYDELTVRQCLTYVVKAQKLSSNKIDVAVSQTAERVQIQDHFQKKSRCPIPRIEAKTRHWSSHYSRP